MGRGSEESWVYGLGAWLRAGWGFGRGVGGLNDQVGGGGEVGVWVVDLGVRVGDFFYSCVRHCEVCRRLFEVGTMVCVGCQWER